MPWQLTIVPEGDRALMKEVAVKALSDDVPETAAGMWTAPYGASAAGPVTHRVSCGWHPPAVDETMRDPKKVVEHAKKNNNPKNVSESAAAAMLARCRTVLLDEGGDPAAYLAGLGLVPVGEEGK